MNQNQWPRAYLKRKKPNLALSERYSREKNAWLDAHPHATKQETNAALNEILRRIIGA